MKTDPVREFRSNIGATKYALAQIVNAPEEQIRNTRLYILKRASHRLGMSQLGAFCRKVDASEAELAALIRDRAAQKGSRPAVDLIQ